MSAIHKIRLLNVARALRESPNPGGFSMGVEFHECGTPACAWGHYVSRTDLQDHFIATPEDREDGFARSIISGEMLIYDDGEVMQHFGVTKHEISDLFCASGCNKAATAIEAAEWIEQFAQRKWPETVRSQKLAA